MQKIDRREFLKSLTIGGAAAGFGSILSPLTLLTPTITRASVDRPVVGVVRIKNGNIDYAIRNVMDLLGGIRTVTAGKERILVKPNLVSPTPSDVTKPGVIKSLVQLMTESGKDVCIGEGSAAASPNFRPGILGRVCRTTNPEILNKIQQIVFERLGYSDLAKTLKVPLIGLYPGQVYGTVRSAVHAEAARVERSGTASAIVDMVRANKLGLVVIDGSVAMQGQGPSVSQGGGGAGQHGPHHRRHQPVGNRYGRGFCHGVQAR